MKRRRCALLGVVLAMAVIASSCADGAQEGGGAESQQRTQLTFIFPVQDEIQFFPWYLAEERGYFADEGLDVNLEVADGSSAAIQQLVSGNADAVLSAPGAFLTAAATGQDLRWIFTLQYQNIFTVVAPADSGITSIEELRGKNLGISEPSGGEVPLVRGILRSAGLVEGRDVRLVPVGEGSALTVNALRKGRVDAYSSTIFDVAAIQSAGIATNVILPEVAQNFPADGIVARAESLEGNQENLIGLGRAVVKGIAFGQENPEAAFDMMAEIAPEAFEDRDTAQRFWDISAELLNPPTALEGQPIGAHPVKGFEAYHDFLLQGEEEEGALPQPVDLAQVLDESLLDKMNDFNRDTL